MSPPICVKLVQSLNPNKSAVRFNLHEELSIWLRPMKSVCRFDLEIVALAKILASAPVKRNELCWLFEVTPEQKSLPDLRRKFKTT